MTDEFHERAKEIFLAGRELPPGERRAYVAQTCGNDLKLLREVESLLAHIEQSHGFADTHPASPGLPHPFSALNYLDRFKKAVADRYVIERQLGEGGMAEVYLAQDLKHDRQVAVKVLRPELAAALGPERFLHEIKVTANLQHPHILQLFDSGEADGLLFYVMPYVAGESLRDRLNRETQLPIDDALQITKAVASALDYAHRHHIIHRDIKPENILLQDGQPVVSDFGIALAVSAAGGQRLTKSGVSFGTPQYMSPEQATRDRELDARSDLYSLACVTYEMVSGVPPHTGSSAQEIIAAIVTEDPLRLSRRRRTVPPHVEAAVHKALQKLPADRFSNAAHFSNALDNPAFTAPETMTTSRRAPVGSRGHATLVLAAVLAAVALWGWLRPRPVPPNPVVRYRMTLPYEARFDLSGGGSALTISPDGSRLVYVGPWTRLWTRERDQLDPSPIPGTEAGNTPFFSPDGASVGFFQPSFAAATQGKLNVVSMEGGPPITLADSGVGATGGSWGDDGYIYLDDFNSELVRIPAIGGAREVLTTLDTTRGERGHRWPDMLPNQRGLLMTVVRGSSPAEWVIEVLDLANLERRMLVRGVMAKYSASGHLVFVAADGTLMAAPFDQDRLALTGDATALADGLHAPVSSITLSENGRLLYVTAGNWSDTDELVWLTRDGTELPIDSDWTGSFQSLSISPDGTQLAVTVVRQRSEQLWIKKLNGDPPSKLTLEGTVNRRPSWLPDGRSVLFVSDRGGEGTRALYAKRADGTAAPEVVLNGSRVLNEGLYSPDGEWVVFREGRTGGPRSNLDILAVRPGVDSEPIELASTAFQERSPALSPDGRWLAYVSTRQDRRPEVYVQPFPDAGDALWRVSTTGGQEPVWAHSGRELFYRNGANEMVSIEIETTPTFSIKNHTVLFQAGAYATNSFHVAYDVAPDDQRFAMIRYGPWQPGELVVVENFFEELKVRGTP